MWNGLQRGMALFISAIVVSSTTYDSLFVSSSHQITHLSPPAVSTNADHDPASTTVELFLGRRLPPLLKWVPSVAIAWASHVGYQAETLTGRSEVIIKDGYDSMSQAAAELNIEEINKVIEEQGQAVLLMPTGNSPLGTYKRLVQAAKEGRIDLSKVVIFMLDEYRGGADYRHFIQINLLAELVGVPLPKVYVINGNVDDTEPQVKGDRKFAERVSHELYENLIKNYGGIDFAMLGVGVQGHIGFNEAGTDFNAETGEVKLAKSTIRENSAMMESVQAGRDPYTHAYTSGIRTILGSRRVLVLASGDKKAPIINKYVNGSTTKKNPISALHRHPDVTLIIDRDAASQMKGITPDTTVFTRAWRDIRFVKKPKANRTSLDEDTRVGQGEQYGSGMLRVFARLPSFAASLRRFVSALRIKAIGSLQALRTPAVTGGNGTSALNTRGLSQGSA